MTFIFTYRLFHQLGEYSHWPLFVIFVLCVVFFLYLLLGKGK